MNDITNQIRIRTGEAASNKAGSTTKSFQGREVENPNANSTKRKAERDLGETLHPEKKFKPNSPDSIELFCGGIVIHSSEEDWGPPIESNSDTTTSNLLDKTVIYHSTNEDESYVELALEIDLEATLAQTVIYHSDSEDEEVPAKVINMNPFILEKTLPYHSDSESF